MAVVSASTAEGGEVGRHRNRLAEGGAHAGAEGLARFKREPDRDDR